MSRRPTISACVIARNEADELADCLAGLTWADEIVVVDDESTDATVKVAQRFTPRVLVRAKRDERSATSPSTRPGATGCSSWTPTNGSPRRCATRSAGP